MSRSLRLLALLAIPIVLPHNTLAQPSRAADGDGPVTRVTWTPNPDGSVRRHNYVRAEEE